VTRFISHVLSLIERVEVRNFAPLPHLTIDANEAPGGVSVVVSSVVAERDDGTAMPLALARFVPDGGEDASVFDAIYSAILGMLLHELNEAWHIDGVRVRDPHARPASLPSDVSDPEALKGELLTMATRLQETDARLTALIGALPRCADCERVATHEAVLSDDFYCDDHVVPQPIGFGSVFATIELPWANAVRGREVDWAAEVRG